MRVELSYGIDHTTGWDRARPSGQQNVLPFNVRCYLQPTFNTWELCNGVFKMDSNTLSSNSHKMLLLFMIKRKKNQPTYIYTLLSFCFSHSRTSIAVIHNARNKLKTEIILIHVYTARAVKIAIARSYIVLHNRPLCWYYQFWYYFEL